MKHSKLKPSSIILLGFAITFLVLAVHATIRSRLIAFDRFTATIFCFLFFLISRKYDVHPIIAFLAGLIFVPHEIGLHGMYSSAKLNYHYDWIAHPVSCFITAIVLAYFLARYLSKNLAISAAIAFSFTITAGAFMEATEYWGFRTIGFGESYLGFGDGDNSQNFGPWENSSIDTTLNILGALAGVLTFAGYKATAKPTTNPYYLTNKHKGLS